MKTNDLIGSPKLFDIAIEERERKEKFFRTARKVSCDWLFGDSVSTGGIIYEKPTTLLLNNEAVKILEKKL